MIATSGQSCGEDSSNIVFKKALALPDTSQILGLDTVCQNQQPVTYEVIATSKYSYDWNISGGIILSGKWSPIIHVHWGQDSNRDTLKVLQTNNLTQCSNIMKLPVVLSKNLSPDRPVIERKSLSNILVCDNDRDDVYYQWGYIDRSTNESFEYPNENLQYINLTEPFDTLKFNYWVRVFVDYEEMTCPSVGYINTPDWLVSFSNLKETISDLKIFPNPFQNEFTITNDLGIPNLSIRVFDFYGKLVFEGLGQNQKMKYELGKFDSGMYFIQVFNGAELLVTKKIIKR